MIALLVALLPIITPGPPSGPIQPPGMICLGACAGPVIYGAAEQRGRLVVACDMRSDTCSDGRRITTTRSTPVPCETSPGVWETVGVDEGCYGVRGLEAWAQNTSYLSYGAELDRSPWVGAAVPASQGYQITGPLSQSMAAVGVAEQRTTAWILRADTPRLVTIGVQPTGGCEVEVGTEWRTYSCTEQVAIGVSPEARITQPVGQSVYGIAAWHTRSATPGRPCWGGEAPVTCARDRHTIGTEGWPTESGEICLTATVSRTDTAVILDGRPGWISQGPLLLMAPNGTIRWESDGVRINSHVVAREVPHRICAGRRDGKLTLSVDGVSVPPIDGPPLAWEPVAVLGDSNGGTSQHIDSSISSLHVRSAE